MEFAVIAGVISKNHKFRVLQIWNHGTEEINDWAYEQYRTIHLTQTNVSFDIFKAHKYVKKNKKIWKVFLEPGQCPHCDKKTHVHVHVDKN